MSLGDVITDALRMADELRAGGMTRDQVHAALEQTLREHWPFTREWKYVCQNCDDLGLQMRTCDGQGACGRTRPHLPHDYGQPCYCKAGAKFEKRDRTQQDAIAAAARTSTKMTRAGR